MGVNSLPNTVTRQRRGCDLNPSPTAPESSTLTTRLPRHPKVQGTVSTQHNMQRYSKICYCYYSSSDTISTNKTHNNNIIIMLAISTTILIITRRAKISVYTSGTDLVTPLRGSLFHVIIVRVTSYFDVVLCPSSSQIPQCSLASLARVPKVTPL